MERDGFHTTHTSPADMPVHYQEVNISCHQTSDRRSLPLLLRNLGPLEGLPSSESQGLPFLLTQPACQAYWGWGEGARVAEKASNSHRLPSGRGRQRWVRVGI